MSGNPQIHAVADVRLESRPDRKDRLRLFYGDLVGLREPREGVGPGRVVFEAHGRRLTVELSERAVASPMRRRVLIQVDSLLQMWQRLSQGGVSCSIVSGVGFWGRRLVTLDPADNRVEFKEVRLL